MCAHFDRAPSTLSEMVEHLSTKQLIEKQKDPNDGRRKLVWLTAYGQTALANEQTVLDTAQLAKAASLLAPDDRNKLIQVLEVLHKHLRNPK